jgi:hypothetical protein
MVPLLLVVSAVAADARGTMDLRILVVAEDTQRAEELYGGLRGAGLLVVDLEERAGVDLAAPPHAELGTRDAAREHLQRARGKLRDLDTLGARADVDAALDEIVRLEHPEDAREIWVDALLVRANLALVDNRADDAAGDLALVSRLAPEHTELSPSLYAPSVVEAYAAARAAALAAPPATLVVRPRAAGFAAASVLVDGRPFAGEALPAGPHAITARAEAGGRQVGQRTVVLTLSPAAPVVFAPFLAPADAAAERARLVALVRTGDAHALAALADASAARAILVESKDARTLFVAGRGVAPLVTASREPAVVGAAVLRALQAPAGARADGTVAGEGEGDNTWLWGVAGAGAVALVGASVGGGFALWYFQSPAPQKDAARPLPVTGFVP